MRYMARIGLLPQPLPQKHRDPLDRLRAPPPRPSARSVGWTQRNRAGPAAPDSPAAAAALGAVLWQHQQPMREEVVDAHVQNMLLMKRDDANASRPDSRVIVDALRGLGLQIRATFSISLCTGSTQMTRRSTW